MASAPPRSSAPGSFLYQPATRPPGSLPYGIPASFAAPLQAGPTKPLASEAYRQRLIAAVDSVPEARGLGVVLSDHGKVTILRPPQPEAPFVVVQQRPSAQAGPAPATTSAPPPEQISVGKEWVNLALNLGGATLSWIGVVGSAAVAPETGGASLGATVLLYSGAAASSLQVANSVTRLVAIYSGKGHWVGNLDHNAVYTRTSTALDVIGLVGAAGAARETVATARALGEANSTFREGLGALSRQQRLRFTQALELQGARRVAAARINLVLKLKLVDAFGSIYGAGTGAYSGVVHDIVVFIVEPADAHK